jgi:coenzyme F420-reducing hydrogenase delta subunit
MLERIRRYFQLLGKEEGIYVKVNPDIHDSDPGFANLEQATRDLMREISRLQIENERLELEKTRLAMENERLVNISDDLNAKLAAMGGSTIDFRAK